MMSINLSDISGLKINGADYWCITNGTSNSETVHLLQKTDLSKKVKHWKAWKFIVTFTNGWQNDKV